MKIAFFDAHDFEVSIFEEANNSHKHDIQFFNTKLSPKTAALAKNFPVVCAFVNDDLGAETLQILKSGGTKLIALRCAGFNHVDLKAAADLGITLVRVPEYSPYSVAEHSVALILTLNRKTHRAFNRVREGNFSLSGLVGFDLKGKTVGVIGTGKIGQVFARIMRGFGCEVLLFDVNHNEAFAKEIGGKYVPLDELFKTSDIISLHVPLNPATRYLINEKAISQMKDGVMLINTGRGALIDTRALINNLKSGKVGSAGLDVYEEEAGIFFSDLSCQILSDDVLARLMTFPNVVITGHQAFLTTEALNNIADTTLSNISDFERSVPLINKIEV